ncbi:MAG TPA: C45 family peptidase [Planctomycetaceae bacterium]|nr:C45 family peptidase [Planctomycetaceae bacterium]
MPNARYPEITVAGSPRELGRQIGDAAGELIRGFCTVAMERVNQTVRITREAAMDTARKSIPYAERYAPDMVEELRGTAETARVTLEDLMLLQVRNQLRSTDAGCTSFSVAPPRSNERFVAQNWDNDPGLDPFTLVLTRKPTGKPASTTLTQAGLIGYIGFNDAGIGVCLNSLPAPSRPLGVPHYFMVREILEAKSLDDVVHAVNRAERAIPANIMLSTPQGPADLEVTIDHVHVLTDPRNALVTHTNHCKHPELAAINPQYDELIQSHARQCRIDELLGKPSGTLTIADLQSALRDHTDYPTSICRHSNADPAFGFWATVFSVIIATDSREMHITRGTPCDRAYDRYSMT